jgi:hypothetical protein
MDNLIKEDFIRKGGHQPHRKSCCCVNSFSGTHNSLTRQILDFMGQLRTREKKGGEERRNVRYTV